MKRIVSHFEGQLVVYVGGIALFLGAISTYWDIATHIDVGRERFLTPAHIGIYTSVLVSGIALMLSGLSDHFRHGDSLAATFRHPFKGLRPGIAVAGAGMLTALAAAPLDNGWHEVYGLDVTIWSPPHLLAILGIAAASLGLAALVSPAASGSAHPAYPLLLAAFLTALVMTTAEYEFNAPQYRIAYHVLTLSAIATFVLTAASGRGWRATKVAIWFEVVRGVSVLVLLALGHSLAFVPILIPAALVADALAMRRMKGSVIGLAVATIVVVANWAALELLPGLSWAGDDLLMGASASLIAGSAAGWLGWRLGRRLDGEAEPGLYFGRRRAPALALLGLFLFLTAAPALAHELGGNRGGGLIEWSPQTPEAGQRFEVRISDLALESGNAPGKLRLEAWRAERRIKVSTVGEGDVRTAKLTLPEEGPWFLFVRAQAAGENLLWGDRFTVAAAGEGISGEARQRFTLGVDTLTGDEPPAWVDWIAYGIAVAILLLLIRGVLRALAQLPQAELGREPVA